MDARERDRGWRREAVLSRDRWRWRVGVVAVLLAGVVMIGREHVDVWARTTLVLQSDRPVHPGMARIMTPEAYAVYARDRRVEVVAVDPAGRRLGAVEFLMLEPGVAGDARDYIAHMAAKGYTFDLVER